MTDIEKKALALVNEVETERGMSEWTDVCRSELTMGEALCRAIGQHEAFRQEVSDAVEAYLSHTRPWPDNSLRRFIITKPVDPLFEVVQEWWETGSTSIEETTDELREAIAKRGGQIVWGDE